MLKLVFLQQNLNDTELMVFIPGHKWLLRYPKCEIVTLKTQTVQDIK